MGWSSPYVDDGLVAARTATLRAQQRRASASVNRCRLPTRFAREPQAPPRHIPEYVMGAKFVVRSLHLVINGQLSYPRQVDGSFIAYGSHVKDRTGVRG
jgi:hypothetical protein